jgi:hypothetical protein
VQVRDSWRTATQGVAYSSWIVEPHKNKNKKMKKEEEKRWNQEH